MSRLVNTRKKETFKFLPDFLWDMETFYLYQFLGKLTGDFPFTERLCCGIHLDSSVPEYSALQDEFLTIFPKNSLFLWADNVGN